VAVVSSGPIRVAIVGTGGIARIHAAALRSGVPGPATAVLAAATDIDPDRLAGFAREHGVPATWLPVPVVRPQHALCVRVPGTVLRGGGAGTRRGRADLGV
jgi:hypothetical protein